MKILYVTTFNKPIWKISANKMIDSFLRLNCDGDMLLCYEGFELDISSKKYINPKLNKKANLIPYDISKDLFLKNWLKENNDVIPPEMGGSADMRRKPEAFLPWNFRAAGWFRKIASMSYALDNYGDNYDCIVFVDADCVFTKRLDSSVVFQAFKGHSYFYHWGLDRPKKGLGVESGFIGFKNDKLGYGILSVWINKFKNKTFRRYLRWDDGGMFGNVVLENPNSGGNDLVVNYADKTKSASHVINRGIFAKYIVHNKGVHKKTVIKERRI